MLYHVHVEQKIEREQVAKVTGTNKDDSAGLKKPVQRKEIKYIRTIHAHAEAARNINSAVDVFKSILATYTEPLVEVRDSL